MTPQQELKLPLFVCRSCMTGVRPQIADITKTCYNSDVYEPSDVTSADVIQTDLVHPLVNRLQNAVDILVFNPPYVVTPDEEVGRGGIAAAWAGGYNGRQVIDRVIPLVPGLLAPGGHFFMVTVPDNDPAGILKELTQHGLQGSIVLNRRADEEFLQILHVTKH